MVNVYDIYLIRIPTQVWVSLRVLEQARAVAVNRAKNSKRKANILSHLFCSSSIRYETCFKHGAGKIALNTSSAVRFRTIS